MKFIIFLVFLLIFIGCSSIQFKDSMPKRVKSSILIDSSLIGEYYYVDSIFKNNDKKFYNNLVVKDFYKNTDSTEYINAIIKISSQYIFCKITYGKTYRLEKVDTSKIYIDKDYNQKIIFDNNIFCFGSSIDTILNLNADDKFIQWKNKYYLNTMINKRYWEIIQLECVDIGLISLNLTDENDAKALGLQKSRGVYHFTYNASLTNHQFKKFVNSGGFRTRYRFKKYAR